MLIGVRIKKIRESTHLDQIGFSKELGIKQGYLSALENSKKTPSEQLILGICRAFSVNYNWLTEGKGEMYDKSSGAALKGISLIEEIHKRLVVGNSKVPATTVAYVVGIDPYHAQNDAHLNKTFYDALSLLIEISKEGDQRKLDAVMAQLRVLDPRPKVTTKIKKKAM